MAGKPLPRKCSEFEHCGKFLVHEDGTPMAPTAKTCSVGCRQRRAKRLKRWEKRPVQIAAMNERTRIPQELKDALEDVGHEVMREELRPIVREAMTPEAMDSLGQMVGLLPGVMAELAKDIHNPDDVVRQKAHAFVLKYTLGHEKVIPSDSGPAGGLTVVLGAGMTPPADTSPPVESTATPDDGPTDLRQCDTCGELKLESDFIGDAQRCNECVAMLQEKARAFLDPPKESEGG